MQLTSSSFGVYTFWFHFLVFIHLVKYRCYVVFSVRGMGTSKKVEDACWTRVSHSSISVLLFVYFLTTGSSGRLEDTCSSPRNILNIL